MTERRPKLVRSLPERLLDGRPRRIPKTDRRNVVLPILAITGLAMLIGAVLWVIVAQRHLDPSCPTVVSSEACVIAPGALRVAQMVIAVVGAVAAVATGLLALNLAIRHYSPWLGLPVALITGVLVAAWMMLFSASWIIVRGYSLWWALPLALIAGVLVAIWIALSYRRPEPRGPGSAAF